MAIGTGTAMLIGSGLSAAGSLAGGLFGGGNNSGAAQSAANQAYLAAQHQAEVNKSDASPWTSAGREALNELGGLIGWGNLSNPGTNGSLWTYGGDPTGQFRNSANSKLSLFKNNLYGVGDKFEADPGYAWRVSEGNKALDRSAAAKGGLYSGGQLKALTDYNSNVASNEYGNWWNRNASATDRYINLLSGISGSGANMQSGVNSANTGLTSQQGNYLMAGGNAAMAGANAADARLWGGINSAAQNLLTGGLYYGMYGGGGTKPTLSEGQNSSNLWGRVR